LHGMWKQPNTQGTQPSTAMPDTVMQASDRHLGHMHGR
jgi:hypothetical protein